MIQVKRTPRHAALPPGCQDTVRESHSLVTVRRAAPVRMCRMCITSRGITVGEVHDLCFILRNHLDLLASLLGLAGRGVVTGIRVNGFFNIFRQMQKPPASAVPSGALWLSAQNAFHVTIAPGQADSTRL